MSRTSTPTSVIGSDATTSTSSGSLCNNKEIQTLTLKSTIGHLKNENTELTETIQRQNCAFLAWQKSLQQEISFLDTLLSSRQRKKYVAWKTGQRDKSKAASGDATHRTSQSCTSTPIHKTHGRSVSCASAVLTTFASARGDNTSEKTDSVCDQEEVLVQQALTDRTLVLDLRVERDQLLSDKEALHLQLNNQAQFRNCQHERITALQGQVEELRQTAEFLSIKFADQDVTSRREFPVRSASVDITALSPASTSSEIT